MGVRLSEGLGRISSWHVSRPHPNRVQHLYYVFVCIHAFCGAQYVMCCCKYRLHPSLPISVCETLCHQNRQRYEIDMHLKRYPSALNHLVALLKSGETDPVPTTGSATSSSSAGDTTAPAVGATSLACIVASASLLAHDLMFSCGCCSGSPSHLRTHGHAPMAMYTHPPSHAHAHASMHMLSLSLTRSLTQR